MNYKIHNKKFLAIIKAFQKMALKGAKYKIKVFTNY